MKFLSSRIITADIERLVHFYQTALCISAQWSTPDFAEIITDVGTLAIASSKTLAFFGTEVATPAHNRSVILEFLVDDVDSDYARIKGLAADVVQPPTTMPWGNRSLLFRDPDGNLVNFFTPVSPEARKRFAR